MMKPTSGKRRINTVHRTFAPVDDPLPSTFTSAQTSAIKINRPNRLDFH
jgi:hypothetical protein